MDVYSEDELLLGFAICQLLVFDLFLYIYIFRRIYYMVLYIYIFLHHLTLCVDVTALECLDVGFIYYYTSIYQVLRGRA